MNFFKTPLEEKLRPVVLAIGRLVCLLALLAPATMFAGCRSGTSMFGPPGTIYEQRSRAVLSDPFPNNQLGPEVLGGRPRGFETPLAEPVNVQASPFSELNKTNRGFVQRVFGRF